MKILITADLHYREKWFRWLSTRAGDYDLICIAGDLLDMFFREPRIVQAREVRRWIRELAKVTRVAICSGNHDDAGRQICVDRAPVYEWLVALGKEPNIITDGVTEIVNDLIVTTVPYHFLRDKNRSGSTGEISFEGNEELDGLSSITYPRGPTPVRPVRNARRRNFSAHTSRNISFLGTVINIPTLPETVGRKRLTECGCWCLGSFWTRPFRTISF